MKKVYIVTQGSYSDYHIEEVFDNLKAAEDFIADLKAKAALESENPIDKWWGLTYTDIEEWDLLSSSPMRYSEGTEMLVGAKILDGVVGEAKIKGRGRKETYLHYIQRKIKARKGETEEAFLKRSHKILCDEYYAWKAKH